MVSGVVEYPTKYAERLVSIVDSPKSYFGCVLFWLACGFAFTFFGIYQLRDARRV